MADRQPEAHPCGDVYEAGLALDKPSVKIPHYPCPGYCLCALPKGHGSDHRCSDCARHPPN
jgi:hypothetical protein